MKVILVFIAALCLTACAQTVKHTPLTIAEYKAINFTDAGGEERWWGDIAPPNLKEILKVEAKVLKQRYPNAAQKLPTQNLLALSGGGANGAFGAGLLVGWSESGQRPQFDIVTGSSTGAIIAPFAFLGVEYDHVLLDIYASATRDAVYKPKILTGLISGSAISDTSPLAKQIQRYVTPELVQAIADEHNKGRRLFVVTTHFDAMRPMIWDIGYIANERKSDGIDLIRKVILASASIPVLFPPIPIEWQVGEQRFTELHVDGGMTRSVFAYPAQINIKQLDKANDLKLKRNVYVILNGNNKLAYEPAPVGVLGIAERTTYGLLHNQSRADIERIYYLALRDGINFNMIEIPDSFTADRATDFDTEYMKSLLKLGEGIGKKNDFWYKKPPSLR